MGIYPDRGLAFLVCGEVSGAPLLHVQGLTYSVIIGTRATDDRLVHLTYYKERATTWFDGAREQAVQLPHKPPDLQLTEDEVARIWSAAPGGAWYDVTTLSMTY